MWHAQTLFDYVNFECIHLALSKTYNDSEFQLVFLCSPQKNNLTKKQKNINAHLCTVYKIK